MLRHILVPLDGSHLAAAAIPYAVTLALADAAQISLFAAIDPLATFGGRSSAAAVESEQRQAAESAAYLDAVAATIRTPALAVTTVVRQGNPASAILAYAQEAGCTLVVMSTHGRTGFDRLRRGSVAQHVLRHATIPTLVVPSSTAPIAAGVAAITGLTVTLDGSPLAEDALPTAAQLATALAVPLTLLQVIPALPPMAYGGWAGGYDTYYPMSPEQEAADNRAVEEYLAAAARLRAPGLDVRTHAVRGATNSTVNLIAAYLAERPTGLAVLASHGRGGVLRWVLGSTAEGVLDQAPCPILIVRAESASDTMPAPAPAHAEVVAHASLPVVFLS